MVETHPGENGKEAWRSRVRGRPFETFLDLSGKGVSSSSKPSMFGNGELFARLFPIHPGERTQEVMAAYPFRR